LSPTFEPKGHLQVSDTAAFLTRERDPILDAAGAALARMHAHHYEQAGAEEVRERLSVLFDQLIDGVAARDLGPIVAYARQVAEQRFAAGYDLSEVQTAFNALEEATWTRVLEKLDSSQFAEALGLISTVLGAGKDALARRYVSLAANKHAPSLDLRALFAGGS
jgi:hypothetical protein